MAPQTHQQGSNISYRSSFGRHKTMTAPLAVSLVCIVVGLVFLIWAITPVFVAITRTNPDPNAAQIRLTELIEESQELQNFSVENYEGRYAFNQRDVKPWPTPRRTAPPAPERPKVAQPAAPVAPRGPSPAPTNYGGPDLIALAGFQAWFDGGSKGPIRIMLGQEQANLRLIDFISSKAARVAWQRNNDTEWGEYEVPVFERDDDGPWSKVTGGTTPSGLEIIKTQDPAEGDGSPLKRPIGAVSATNAQPQATDTPDSKAGETAKKLNDDALVETNDSDTSIGDHLGNAAKATGEALKKAFSGNNSDESESKKPDGDSDAE